MSELQDRWTVINQGGTANDFVPGRSQDQPGIFFVISQCHATMGCMLACRTMGIWHDKQNEEGGRKSGIRMQLGIAGSCRAAEAIRLITKKEEVSAMRPWAACVSYQHHMEDQ